MFQKNSGLDNSSEALNNGKSYFEITQNGDHFIFMALEGSFHVNDSVSTCPIEEFSDEQLNWLKGLLEKYSGDGHNIFVIEHALFYKYGAGDRTDAEPYYSGYLNDSRPSTQKLKKIFNDYKDIIFISGHTHIELAQQYNYSTNNKSSCQMIHDSSVGGSRNIVNGALNFSYTTDETEGYIVEVYADRIIFRGTNITSGLAAPTCTYLVKTSSQMIGKKSVIDPVPLCGDADDSGEININDSTLVQKYIVELIGDDEIDLKNADANGDGIITIGDSTDISKYTVELVDELPVKSEQDKKIVDFTELLEQCDNMLFKGFTYSSYNQYMTLKKEVKAVQNNEIKRTAFEHRKLSNYLDAMVELSQIDPSTSEVNVFFENTNKWSNIYAYAWSGGNYNAPWPGVKLEKYGTSVSGKNVYKAVVDMKKFGSIIFNNGAGTSQTVDISLKGKDVAYKITGSATDVCNVVEIPLSDVIR